MAENVILAEQTFPFVYNSGFGAYVCRPDDSFLETLQDEENYRIVWDGQEFVRTAFGFVNPADSTNNVAVGNTLVTGGENNNDPFAVVCDLTNGYNYLFSLSNESYHVVSIYRIVEEPEEPENEVGIVIKNYHGEDVTYNNVEKVMFNTSDGGTQIFSKGEAVENVPISVDFSGGDQTVIAPNGTLVKSAIIQKPVNLVAENIVSGVEVAGITGTHVTEGEAKTVPLNMADGDMVVEPTEGKLLSSVTVQKPATLIPENIAKDVDIAGIIGTRPEPALPIEMLTETEMNFVLENATAEDVGKVYKYVGLTNDIYENGALYILEEVTE